MPVEQARGVAPVVHQRLALHREHRNAGGRDRRRRMVLGRVDVARHPADVGAERRKGFDQDRGLDRHVQGAGDARALQRLLGAVFLACRHQAGHFGFGQRDFLAAEIGKADVGDDVVGIAAGGFRGGGGHLRVPVSGARSTCVESDPPFIVLSEHDLSESWFPPFGIMLQHVIPGRERSERTRNPEVRYPGSAREERTPRNDVVKITPPSSAPRRGRSSPRRSRHRRPAGGRNGRRRRCGRRSAC